MRKFFALLLTLLIISCASDSSKYDLNGKAIGFSDGTEIIVFTITEDNQPEAIDTLAVTNESFSGSFDKSEKLMINFLQIDGVNGNVLYFPENTNLEATVYKDSIQNSFVSGSQQNDSYKEFNKNILAFNQLKTVNMEAFKQARREKDNVLAANLRQEGTKIGQDEIAYKMEYIKENSNSLFAVLLLTEMVGRKQVSASEATSIVDNLSPKVSATSSADQLNDLIKTLKKADVGSDAPAFAAPQPNGESLALSDALGKYTIIDFWASWCKPCRMENPNVVRVYNEYHDKGLNIISVSLDKAGQKDRWLKAIEDDQMDWYHVSNLQGWGDPIAKTYSVRSIPATFLLDENGTIIAKNLRGKALGDKMAALLGD